MPVGDEIKIITVKKKKNNNNNNAQHCSDSDKLNRLQIYQQ